MPFANMMSCQILNPTSKVRAPLQGGVIVSSGRHQLLLPSHEDLLASETDMNKILMLKQCLSGVQAIHNALALAECRSSLLGMFCQTYSPESLEVIRAVIDDKIEKDAIYGKSPIAARNNRIWAIRVSFLLLDSIIDFFASNVSSRLNRRVFWSEHVRHSENDSMT
jgi:hypothetical protein